MNLTLRNNSKQVALHGAPQSTVTVSDRKTVRTPKSLSFAVTPFVLSRAIIFLLLVFISQLTLSAIPARYGENYSPGFSFESQKVSQSLHAVFSSADSFWYQDIAANGYDAAPATSERAHNWVFFPLYPLLLRCLTAVAPSFAPGGLGAISPALALSALCFFISLPLLYRFAQIKGLSDQEASRALWLLAFFPTSYFFSTPHTEALFLLLLIGAFSAVAERRIWLGSFAMCLAAACRPTGVLILPAFAAALLEQRGLGPRHKLCALLIACSGAAAFSIYLYNLTGDPFAFATNQAAWGRGDGSLLQLMRDLVNFEASLILPWNFVALNLGCAVLALAVSIWLVRKKEIALALLVAVPVLVSISTGTVQSIARFTLTLFPVFLVLAVWIENQNTERAILLAFAVLLTIMTIGYALSVTAAMA